MSVLIYNGVNLGYLMTHTIDQVVEYDPTHTDQTLTKFVIKARSFIVGKAGTVAANMIPIRQALARPRKALTYSENGVNYLNIPASGDDWKGPLPIGDPIVTPITSEAFFIDFSVETWLRDCSAASQNAGVPQFSSNRYKQTQHISDKGISTITTTGRIMCRSDVFQFGSADCLRGLVTPPPRNGFERDATYTLQEDGLAMDYSIIDKQRYMMPPPGCVDAKGSFTVSTTQGSKYFAQVDIRLEGDFSTPRLNLMQMAIAIAAQRLQQAYVQNPVGKSNLPIIVGGHFREELYENVVEISLRALAKPPGLQSQTTGGIPGTAINAIQAIGTVFPVAATVANYLRATNSTNNGPGGPGSAPEPLPLSVWSLQFGMPVQLSPFPPGVTYGGDQVPLEYGLTGQGMPGLKFIAQAFQDACLQNATSGVMTSALAAVVGPTATQSTLAANNIATASQSIPGSSQGSSLLGTSTVEVVSQLPPAVVDSDVSLFSDDEPGVYDYYYVEMEYDQNPGIAAMPGTAPGTATAFPQYMNSYTQVKVAFTASKMGDQPTIPPTVSEDDNLTFLHGTRINPQVEVAGDGQTVIYSKSGVYTYGVADDSTLDEADPIPPWVTLTQADLADDNFDLSIIYGTDAGDNLEDQTTESILAAGALSGNDGVFLPPGQGSN